MEFEVKENCYYYKFYDVLSHYTYDARYNMDGDDNYIATIRHCINTESYEVALTNVAATCIFICDTDTIKKRIIINMTKCNPLSDTTEMLSRMKLS